MHRQHPAKLFVYHGGCDDGWGAAFAAYLKHGSGPHAQYIGVDHRAGTHVASVCAGKDVFFMDICFSKPEMLEILGRSNSLLVLDHHKAAMDEIGHSERWATFDNNRSGAMMAWDYFHGPRTPPPAFIKHIQDSDLHLFRDPNTHPFIAKLRTFRQNFEDWTVVYRQTEKPQGYADFVRDGKIVHDAFLTDCEVVMQQKTRIVLNGIQGLAVNAPGKYATEIGVRLSQESETFGCVWYVREDGGIKASLRSSAPKSADPNLVTFALDVNSLAQKIPFKLAGLKGGGGHHSAAAFIVPFANRSRFIDTITAFKPAQ